VILRVLYIVLELGFEKNLNPPDLWRRKMYLLLNFGTETRGELDLNGVILDSSCYELGLFLDF